MSDRVASNTVIGLLEVVLMAVISLFSVRLVLRALGTVDYGIFTVLGASGVLSAIVITGFNTAAVRYLALAAGSDDAGLRRSTMASTTSLYLAMTVILFVIAVVVRGPLLAALEIPADRRATAGTVYWTVVAQFCFGAIAAPFVALRHAHQRFALVSFAEVGQRLLLLGFLIALGRWPTIGDDALRSVAFVTLLGALMRLVVVVGRTLQQLPASRFRFGDGTFDEARLIARFAQWSILNMVSAQVRSQVVVLLINVSFGAVANAAYAIGLSTNAMVQRFARAFNKSLQPAMTSLYGSDKDRDLSGLISVGCRYATTMSIAPLATVFVEMDNFLDLWLGDAPPNAALYARLIVMATFTRLLSTGYTTAINATNEMRVGTLLGVSIDALGVTAGAIMIFLLDGPAWVLPACVIASNTIRNFAYAHHFGQLYGLPTRAWLAGVVRPVGFSLLAVLGCVWTVTLVFDASLIRLASAGIAALAATAAAVRWIVSQPQERAQLTRWARRTMRLEAAAAAGSK